MTFSEKLRALRKESGLSVRELADLTFTGHTTINRWERGYIPDAFSILLKLCEVLGVSPNELLGWWEVSKNAEKVRKQRRKGADFGKAAAGHDSPGDCP